MFFAAGSRSYILLNTRFPILFGLCYECTTIKKLICNYPRATDCLLVRNRFGNDKNFGVVNADL